MQIVQERLVALPLQHPCVPVRLLPELTSAHKTVREDFEHVEEELEEDIIPENEIKDEDLEGIEINEEMIREILQEMEDDLDEIDSDILMKEIFKSRAELNDGSDDYSMNTADPEDDPIALYRNKTPPEVFSILREKNAVAGRFK